MLVKPDEFIVTVANLPEEKAEAMAVRIAVFVEEQHVPIEEEADKYDETATHFVCRLPKENRVIGTARLIQAGENSAKIGRVAILSEFRKNGAGRKIMERVELEAVNRGMTHLTLEAQLHAIPFYEKIGYQAEGPVFLDAGIEHRRMTKQLK